MLRRRSSRPRPGPQFVNGRGSCRRQGRRSRGRRYRTASSQRDGVRTYDRARTAHRNGEREQRGTKGHVGRDRRIGRGLRGAAARAAHRGDARAGGTRPTRRTSQRRTRRPGRGRSMTSKPGVRSSSCGARSGRGTESTSTPQCRLDGRPGSRGASRTGSRPGRQLPGYFGGRAGWRGAADGTGGRGRAWRRPRACWPDGDRRRSRPY